MYSVSGLFYLPKRASGGTERSVCRSLVFPTSSPSPANCSSWTHPDSHLFSLPNTENNRCQFHKVTSRRDIFDRAREKILNNVHNVKVLLTPLLQICCYIGLMVLWSYETDIMGSSHTFYCPPCIIYLYVIYILRLANMFSIYCGHCDQHFRVVPSQQRHLWDHYDFNFNKCDFLKLF